jgi:signal transduction histidine kinase
LSPSRAGAAPRFVRILLFMLALAAWGWPLLAISATTVFPRAEAVRSDWNASEPPADGWESVNLPDAWNARWPQHDGVVWYRMRWQQRDLQAPTAVLVDSISLAGAVWVNGAAVWRDASLVEPLSRGWNMPRYFQLGPPLLQPGENVLLVRVSGRVGFQPWLGPVTVGPAEALRDRFRGKVLVQRDYKLASLAMQVALASFFGVLWLMRRREVAYGWFALESALWIGFSWNQLALSPWPFPDTPTYQAAIASLLLLWWGAMTLFVLRFFERRHPRLERILWALVMLGVAALFLVPESDKGMACALAVFAGGVGSISTCLLFVLLALRGKQTEQRALAVAYGLYVVAGVHDMLVYFRLIGDRYYYTDGMALITTLAIAAVLAWRYTRQLRRIENFSAELGQEVAQARSELAAHLQQQHALEVSHARIGERLNLVRDLHDGLGGTLTGSIAAIEQTPESLSAPQLLKVLKQVRDDLRLIIDASATGAGDGSLGEQLVPLRHRMSRLLDANGIACLWQIEAVQGLQLGASQTLDVLRFVQEALSNALKHSGASVVEVNLAYSAPRLRVEVRDNGRGLSGEVGKGAGMQSMQARARRLGGEFRFEPRPGATRAWMEAVLA